MRSLLEIKQKLDDCCALYTDKLEDNVKVDDFNESVILLGWMKSILNTSRAVVMIIIKSYTHYKIYFVLLCG